MIPHIVAKVFKLGISGLNLFHNFNSMLAEISIYSKYSFGTMTHRKRLGKLMLDVLIYLSKKAKKNLGLQTDNTV